MQLRQVRDQLVRQCVGEGRVTLIATHESKRQHRQRRPGDPIQARNHVCKTVLRFVLAPFRSGRRRAARDFCLRDEPVPLAMDRLDELLRLAVVPERLPRRFDPASHRRVRDAPTVPDLFDDLVPGNQALAVLHQQREQCEDLRLQAHGLAARAQLDGRKIQLEVTERVDHPRQE